MPSKGNVPAPARGAKLTIGFGMVNVDVKYAPLVKSDTGRVAGRMLCSDHLAPIKSQAVCSEGGEPCEAVTGYEVDGRFVVVEKDGLGLEATRRLELGCVVAAGSLDPLYVEKSYLLWPQAGHEQGFDLLAAVLRQSGKAAVGTTVLNKATRAIFVRWSEAAGCLVAHACTYDARIAWPDVELVQQDLAGRAEPSPQLLAAAELLLGSIAAESFDFGSVVDEYASELREAIARAADGAPAPAKETAKEAPPPVDLLAALTASIAQAKGEKKSRKVAKV